MYEQGRDAVVGGVPIGSILAGSTEHSQVSGAPGETRLSDSCQLASKHSVTSTNWPVCSPMQNRTSDYKVGQELFIHRYWCAYL